MLVCICGGVVEVALAMGAISLVTIVSAWITNLYNRYKCRKHNCEHKCKRA